MTRIEICSFRPARQLDVASGLLGFVRVDIDSLRVDGITVRRALTGRYAVSFPARRDRAGVEHSIVAPVTGAVGRDLESQILSALAARGDIA